MIRAATYLSMAVVASAAFAATADACALRCRASACYSCDSCFSGCGSCGYDSCGSCGFDACGGCGCLDKLKAKMACRRAARQARKCCGDCCGSSSCGDCGSCGGSCGDGCGSCGDGGCNGSCAINGNGGCSNCASGGSDGEVIYDSAQPVETPAADAPADAPAAPPIPDPSAQMLSPFRQTAMHASASVAEVRADDAVSLYMLALSYYDQGATDEAASIVARAAEVERAQPIRDWGRRMERVQGHRRVWLESARAAQVSREL